MATREQVLADYESRLAAGEGVYGFFGKHRPLSNFHLENFVWEGIVWPASENAYMASKTDPAHPDPSFSEMSPNVAKKAGQEVRLVEGWDHLKYSVMLSILIAKFRQCPNAREVLLSTDTLYLEETNWWNDKTWGRVDGAGDNRLGKALMVVRDWI